LISLVFIITAIAILCNWLAIVMAGRLELVDIPDSRKQHQGAVPLTGGIAVFLTVLIGSFALDIAPYTYGMLAIAFLVFAVGVYDDRRHIRASLRLLIQYSSGIALAGFGGIAIHNVGNLLALGDIPLLALTLPLTALSVAGLCNAYNMIDGIDGLAAATILLPLVVLNSLAVLQGHPMAGALLLMVVPVCVFLVFNLGPGTALLPKIFLGDGGSTTLGFLVTASLVYLSQGDNALILPVTALWLVTVPLMDMIATMLRRWRMGRNLMEADRSHLHHTLMNMGLSARRTLIVIVAYAAVCASIGLALENVAESLSLLLYFLLFLGHCSFVVLSDRQSRITVTE